MCKIIILVMDFYYNIAVIVVCVVVFMDYFFSVHFHTFSTVLFNKRKQHYLCNELIFGIYIRTLLRFQTNFIIFVINISKNLINRFISWDSGRVKYKGIF